MGVKYVADGKVVIDVILDDGRVVKGVADINKSFGKMGGVAKKASVSVGSVFKALGLVALAKKGIDMVTGALDGAISRYDTLNNFPRVMQQIGFSAGDSEKAINRLSDGIQGLPTTLDDVAGTAQRIAVLTGDLDGAVETTLALNNAFISSGSSQQDAARGLEQYVQMLSKGEVDLQSWRTLQETMGVALNDTAKAFGFAGASAQNDLYDALKDGHITFDEFNAKIIELSNEQDGFADRALTASGGIKTAYTNMKTAVVRGVTSIIESIDNVLSKTPLKSIENILNGIGKVFNKVLTGIADKIDNLGDKFSEFNSVGDLFIGVFKSISKEVPNYINGIINVIVQNLPNFISGGMRIVLSIAEGIVSSLPALLENGQEILLSLIQGITLVLPELAIAVVQILTMIINTIVENLDMIVNSGLELIQALAFGLLESIDVIVESVVLILTELIGAITESLPIIVEAGITILLSLIDGIISALPQLIDAAVELIMSLIDVVTDNLPMIIDAGIQIVFALIDGLVDATPKIVAAMIVIVLKLLEAIIKSLPKIFSAGIKIALELIRAITSLFGNVFSTGAKIIGKVVSGIFSSIGRIFKAGADIVGKVVSGIVGSIGKVLSAGKDIAGEVISGVSGMATSFFEAGKNIVSSIADGIKGAVGVVTDAIGGVVSKVRDFLPFSPAKVGPLTDIHKLNFGGTIAESIYKGEKEARKAMDDLARSLYSEVNPEFNLLGDLKGFTANAALGRMAPVTQSVQQEIISKQSNASKYDDSKVVRLLQIIAEKDPDLYLGLEKVGSIMDKEQAKRINLQGRRVALD